MIKILFPFLIESNECYAFKINKNSFYLMIDNNLHLLGTLTNIFYIFQQSNWITSAHHKQKVDNHVNA